MIRYAKVNFGDIEDDGPSGDARRLRRNQSLEKHSQGRKQDKENRATVRSDFLQFKPMNMEEDTLHNTIGCKKPSGRHRLGTTGFTLHGLGLTLTFMTVLMFDSITVGYIYKQGIFEAVVGLVSAGTGFVGIFGTLAYPWLQRSIRLERTGLLFLISCITLCVVSMFVNGSPFDPMLIRLFGNDIANFRRSLGIQLPTASSTSIEKEEFTSETIMYFVNDKTPIDDEGSAPRLPSSEYETNFVAHETNPSFVMLIAGICLAKFVHYCWRIAHLKGYPIVALLIQAFSAFANLWIADLAANQFLQELVDDGERGCINGVQQSISVSMGLLKFTMVIFIPWFHTFGGLIIISFLFSCTGLVCYAEFCRRQEGDGRSLLCYFCINCCSRPLAEQEDRSTPITEVVDITHVDELLSSVQVVRENANSGVMITEDKDDSSITDSQV